jgi:ribosomal protein S4
MRYPGYLLNPGDMFQVEPERVMWATGAPKAAKKAEANDGDEQTSEEKESEPVQEQVDELEDEVDVDRDPREVLKELRAKAKGILDTSKRDIGAKRKQDLRAFSSAIKRLLSRSSSSTVLTDSLEAQFAEIQNQLNIRRENRAAGTTSLPSGQDETQDPSSPDETQPSKPAPESQETILTDADYNELYAALRSMQENPVDDSKPYATPWMPRDYMSAFAFVPRFLEVNHNICAAVYLRHPVARPGVAEVPSPYAADVHSTAFAWYLRRR